MADDIVWLGADRPEGTEPQGPAEPRRLSWALGVPMLALLYFAAARIGPINDDGL